MTNLDSLLKSRDITLPTKVCLVKAMAFPIVMYGCQSWTIKKAERRRTDGFELLHWRRLLRVPWTARRSNQSILKEISPEYSLKGLMMKLKLQYFGHLMQRTDSFEKTLMTGKIEGRRRRGWQRMRLLDGITDSMEWVWVNSGSWWWPGRPGMLQSMGSQRAGHDWVTALNWTDPTWGLVVSRCGFTWHFLASNDVWGHSYVLSGHSYLFCDPAYFGKHILQLCEVKLVESIDQIFCIFFSVFFFKSACSSNYWKKSVKSF